MKFNTKLYLLMNLYIISTVLARYFIDIPFNLKLLLAISYIIIVPLVIGEIIYKFLFSFILKIKIRLDNLAMGIIYWNLGLIFLISFVYLLYYFYGFNSNSILTVIISLLLGKLFFFIKNKDKIENNLSENLYSKVTYDFLLGIFTSIVLGLITIMFITHFSPFPYLYGSDTFRHVQISSIIFRNNYILFQEPYLVSSDILISIIQVLLRIGDTYSIFWYSRFLIYPLVSLGIFLVAYEMSNNLELSLAASFVSIWSFWNLYEFIPKNLAFIEFIFGMYLLLRCLNLKFDTKNSITNSSNFIYGLLISLSLIVILFILLLNQFFLFRTFIGIVLFIFIVCTVLVLYYINKMLDKNIEIILSLLIIGISIIITHTLEGFMLATILIFYLVIVILNSNAVFVRYHFRINLVAILIIALLVLFNSHLPTFSPFKYVPGNLIISITDKSKSISSMFPQLVIVISAIGLVLSSNSNNIYEKSFVTLALFSLIIFLLPIVGANRAILALIPVIGYFTAKCMEIFLRLVKRNIKVIIIFLFIVLTSSLLFTHMNIEINSHSSGEGFFSFFTHDEYMLAMWVSEKCPPNTLVISDAFTQNLVAAIAGTKKTPGLERSTYFPNKFPQYFQIVEILSTPQPQVAYIKIKNVVNNKERKERINIYPKDSRQNVNITNVIVVITPKTIRFMMRHTKLSNSDINNGIRKFFDKKYFTPLYNNSKVYIIGVNPEPGVSFKVKP